MGHIISSDGIEPNSDKIEVIQNFPRPKTINELRRFLAMTNYYRRFVPNAAHTQAPLNDYLKKSKKNDKRPVIWNDNSIQAFEKCKLDFSKYTLLSLPDAISNMSLMVDASDIAVGAVLQKHTKEGRRPLAFFSKKLDTAQTKYSA